MRPKVVALIAASSVSLGWLLASVIVPPVARLQVLPDRPERPQSAPREETTTAYGEQLKLRLQQAPSAPVTRRNPFVFGRRTTPAAPAPATSPDRDADVATTPALAAPVVTPPALRLSGIGSTGDVRTAVIADGTTVHLVKVGETVNGYEVVEITEETVTVADASGAQWKLRMK
jgi:hypothetical protein